MSQKVRIKGVHVSTPILINIDANQQPIMSDDPDVIMKYMMDGYRFMKNKKRSTRWDYEDDNGNKHYIGDNDTRKVSELRANYDFIKALPSDLIDTAMQDEMKEWNAAWSRNETLKRKNKTTGKLPGFTRRKEQTSFKIGSHKRLDKDTNERLNTNAVFHKLNKHNGVVIISGSMPRKLIPAEYPCHYKIEIRVQLSEEIRDYTSVIIKWVDRELIFVNEPLPINREPVRTGDDKTSIGLDAGCVHELATSDNTMPFMDLPDRIRLIDDKIDLLNKQQARRRAQAGYADVKSYYQHGISGNYARTQSEISELYALKSRITMDTQHKMTYWIAANFDEVFIENLNLQGMVKSPVAKPDPNHEGAFLPNGAAAKAGLNRSLARAAIGQLFSFLDYKCSLAGVRLTRLNPAFTSQECSACHYIDSLNRENQAVFKCQSCGFEANADVNAALNILNRGLHPGDYDGKGHYVKPLSFNPVLQSRPGHGPVNDTHDHFTQPVILCSHEPQTSC